MEDTTMQDPATQQAPTPCGCKKRQETMEKHITFQSVAVTLILAGILFIVARNVFRG